MIATEELNTGYYKASADTELPRPLAHPVNVVFLGSTPAVSGEFDSFILSENITTLVRDRNDLYLACRQDQADDETFLQGLSETIDNYHHNKNMLFIIYGYQGAKSFTSVRDFLNARYKAVQYEVLLVQNQDECIDLYYSDVYEIEPNESRIDAFRLAMDIFENNDPRKNNVGSNVGGNCKVELPSTILPALKKWALQTMFE